MNCARLFGGFHSLEFGCEGELSKPDIKTQKWEHINFVR